MRPEHESWSESGPSEQEERQAWDRLYAANDAQRIWSPIPALRHLEEALASCARGARILDLACGDGAQALALSPGHVVVGVDYSHAAIELAQKHQERAAAHHCLFLHADACATGFATASFDAVLFIDVLMHFRQPTKVLAEIHRVLAPDGVFLLTTFAEGDEMAPSIASDHLDTLYGAHLMRFYSEGLLRAMIEDAGLKIERLEYSLDDECAHPGFRDQDHIHRRVIVLGRRPKQES